MLRRQHLEFLPAFKADDAVLFNGLLRLDVRSRLPCGFNFLAADFMAVRKRFRLCVFLVPVMTDTVQAAIDVCQAERIPYIVHDTPEQDLTTATLRKAYAAAGVHSWCDSDDSVNANENFLVIHTATAGRKTIRLPRPRTIRPLLPDAAEFTSDTIEIDLQQFETRLFRLA